MRVLAVVIKMRHRNVERVSRAMMQVLVTSVWVTKDVLVTQTALAQVDSSVVRGTSVRLVEQRTRDVVLKVIALNVAMVSAVVMKALVSFVRESRAASVTSPLPAQTVLNVETVDDVSHAA